MGRDGDRVCAIGRVGDAYAGGLETNVIRDAGDTARGDAQKPNMGLRWEEICR